MEERERIIAEILDLHRDAMRLIHGGLSNEWLETEITMPQFKTLLVMFLRGKASMGELADALGTGVSTVTGIVDRLVDHGLVTRDEAPHDRRVVVGRLTPKGEVLVERLYLTQREAVARAFNQLTLDELRLVARAFSLICDAAHRAAPANVTSSVNSR